MLRSFWHQPHFRDANSRKPSVCRQFWTSWCIGWPMIRSFFVKHWRTQSKWTSLRAICFASTSVRSLKASARYVLVYIQFAIDLSTWKPICNPTHLHLPCNPSLSLVVSNVITCKHRYCYVEITRKQQLSIYIFTKHIHRVFISNDSAHTHKPTESNIAYVIVAWKKTMKYTIISNHSLIRLFHLMFHFSRRLSIHRSRTTFLSNAPMPLQIYIWSASHYYLQLPIAQTTTDFFFFTNRVLTKSTINQPNHPYVSITTNKYISYCTLLSMHIPNVSQCRWAWFAPIWCWRANARQRWQQKHSHCASNRHKRLMLMMVSSSKTVVVVVVEEELDGRRTAAAGNRWRSTRLRPVSGIWDRSVASYKGVRASCYCGVCPLLFVLSLALALVRIVLLPVRFAVLWAGSLVHLISSALVLLAAW